MQKCMTLEWLREVYVFYDKVNELLSRYNEIRLYIQEDWEDFDTIPMNNIYLVGFIFWCPSRDVHQMIFLNLVNLNLQLCNIC